MEPTAHGGQRKQYFPWMALLDAALVGAIFLFLLNDAKAVYFHFVFFLLTLGAFYWTFRGLLLRAIPVIAIVSAGMFNFYYTGVVHGEEVSEIPMMTAIFLLVFAIARQRSDAQADLVAANQTLEQKVATRTAALQEEIKVRRQIEKHLRTSEEQYIRLIDLSFDAVSIISMDGTLVYLNRAGLQMIGVTSLDEILGRCVLDFIHPDHSAVIKKRFQVLRDEGRGTLPAEVKIKRPDGHLIDVELMSIPVVYQGKPVIQSVYRDLSDRKRLEQTCAEERLNIADRLHNSLGQSLSYLHLTLQDLADRLLLSESDDLYRTIAHTAEVANEAYGQAYSVLDDLVPLKLPQLRAAIREVATTLGEKGKFETTIACRGQFRSLPPTLRRHILFICREALINVTKHANANHVNIELAWGEDVVRVTIADDGRGFDPSKRDPSASFGLRIMEERVMQLDGIFSLKSAPGVGTEIMFQVPSS